MRRFLKRLGDLRSENPIRVRVGLLVDQLLSRSRERRVRIEGHDLTIRSNSSDLGVALSCLRGEFTPLGDAWPRTAAGLIVDAGGNIGTSALALAAIFPNASVVSMEPSEENFRILAANVAGNARIHAEQAALVAGDGVRQIELRDRGSPVSFTVVSNPHDARSAPVVQIVPALSLREVLSKHGHDRIMILKMDIEGAEIEFFRDPSWLELVDVLMIELHDRVAPGCSEGFRRICEGRFMYRTVGHQYISIGPAYFERKARQLKASQASCHA